MSDYNEDEDPTFAFPVWLVGEPVPPSDDPKDFANGLLTLTCDGETTIPIFTDEQVAKDFLVRHGGETYKGHVPRVVTDANNLDLFFTFLESKMGGKQALIFRPGNRISGTTIAAVRFNMAMQ